MVNETSNKTSTEKDQKETHKERQVCIRAEAVAVAFAFSDVTATDVRCCEKGAPPVLHANKNGKRQYRNTKNPQAAIPAKEATRCTRTVSLERIGMC